MIVTRGKGPNCTQVDTLYALAKAAERNYSNVHTDVSRLEEMGPIQRAEDGAVSARFESIEIRFPLARVA